MYIKVRMCICNNSAFNLPNCQTEMSEEINKKRNALSRKGFLNNSKHSTEPVRIQQQTSVKPNEISQNNLNKQ